MLQRGRFKKEKYEIVKKRRIYNQIVNCSRNNVYAVSDVSNLYALLNKVMCWKSLENKCKQIYNTQFINVSDLAERKLIISLIADEFPDVPRLRIIHAVDKCISASEQRVAPVAFLNKVQRYMS